MNKTTPYILLLTLLMLTSTACRYMDSDLALDDEAFAASLDGEARHITMEDAFFVGGLGLRGTGRSGGSGIGYSSWGHGSFGSKVVRVHEKTPSIAGANAAGALGALALAGGATGVEPEDEDEEERDEEVMSAEDVFILNHTTVEVLAREGAL